MDVLEAIHRRRSIGKVDGEISREVVQELIEAASWAPNHRLTEPWTFTVLSGDARDRFAEFWGEFAASRAGVSGEERAAVVEKERKKSQRAPVIVFVSTRTDPNPEVAFEDHSATAAAIQNLLLAAEAKGVAAMWRTGRMAYSEEVKTYLELDPTDRVIGIVYLGQPAMPAPTSRRRTVREISRWLT